MFRIKKCAIELLERVGFEDEGDYYSIYDGSEFKRLVITVDKTTGDIFFGCCSTRLLYDVVRVMCILSSNGWVEFDV